MMHIFDFFGMAFCHQMAERSFFWGSIQAPVCARCMGTTAGICFGVLFLLLFGRKNGNQPFGTASIVLAGLSFLPIAIDGVGSYMGFWESNNLYRVVTGVLAGYGVPALFLLITNFQPTRENNIPIYRNTKEQVGLLLVSVLYALLLFMGVVPYVVAATISTIGIVLLYACFWFLIVRTVIQNRRFPCFLVALLLGLSTVLFLASIIS